MLTTIEMNHDFDQLKLSSPAIQIPFLVRQRT